MNQDVMMALDLLEVFVWEQTNQQSQVRHVLFFFSSLEIVWEELE